MCTRAVDRTEFMALKYNTIMVANIILWLEYNTKLYFICLRCIFHVCMFKINTMYARDKSKMAVTWGFRQLVEPSLQSYYEVAWMRDRADTTCRRTNRRAPFLELDESIKIHVVKHVDDATASGGKRKRTLGIVIHCSFYITCNIYINLYLHCAMNEKMPINGTKRALQVPCRYLVCIVQVPVGTYKYPLGACRYPLETLLAP